MKRNGSTLACTACGDTFYRRYGEQGATIRPFCSLKCYNGHRRQSARVYVKTGRRHTHRVVAEQALGLPLSSAEVVHHIDGNRMNNAPSNLAVMPSQSDHARCHFGHMPPDELDRYRVESPK